MHLRRKSGGDVGEVGRTVGQNGGPSPFQVITWPTSARLNHDSPTIHGGHPHPPHPVPWSQHYSTTPPTARHGIVMISRPTRQQQPSRTNQPTNLFFHRRQHVGVSHHTFLGRASEPQLVNDQTVSGKDSQIQKLERVLQHEQYNNGSHLRAVSAAENTPYSSTLSWSLHLTP
jgi:hypothetical protein